MIEFVSAIHKHVEDSFILDTEALCNLPNQIQESIPYPICDAEFLPTFHRIAEETTYGLIVSEPFGYGKKIILHGGNGSAGNLGGEAAHLILAESEVLFALLEDDFQRPPHGIYSVGLPESHAGIGRDEAIPVGLFPALAEEEPHVVPSELDIHRYVVATQLATPTAPVLRPVEHLGKLFGRVLLTFIYVLRLTHLNHAQIVAFRVAGRDELNDFGTCEPTVGQHVVEVDILFDDASDHLYHQRYLACVILFQTLGRGTALGMLFAETCIKLFLLHVVVALLPLLSNEAVVEQHLRPAIRNAKEEGLEAEHHRVSDMRIDLPDKFRLDAAFGKVGVIYHQTDRVVPIRRALLLRLPPKLNRNGLENPSPVIRLVGEESVEHVLLTTEKVA